MNQEQFKQHIKDMLERKDSDLTDTKAASAESSQLLAEWKAHLTMLGIGNA